MCEMPLNNRVDAGGLIGRWEGGKVGGEKVIFVYTPNH